MGLCKDSRVTYLNSKGYNVVLEPRAGIEPLDVLGTDKGTTSRLGTMGEIWHSSIAVPAPGPPYPAAGISGTATDQIKVSLGLNLLSNILGGMGSVVGLPKLSSAYQRARNVKYTFGEVVSVGIDAFVAGNYLASGDLTSLNPFVDHYFDGDGTSAFVITEVIKSNTITVTATDDNGTTVGVDLAGMQQLVGGNVSVTLSNSASSDVTYTGPSLLTFGFKTFGIVFINGRWSIHGVNNSGALGFSESDDDIGSPVILGSGGLVRVPAKVRASAAA